MEKITGYLEMKPRYDFIIHENKSIAFNILYLKRRTMEITVCKDRHIIVKVPQDSDLETIREQIKKRANWINKKIQYLEQFQSEIRPRRYVEEESHLYLGRKYRIKFEASEQDRVSLQGGCFKIKTTNTQAEHVKFLLKGWYKEKATVQFAKILEERWCQFDHKRLLKPKLKIRAMKTRWGSLSSLGNMNLNLELIRAPKKCIEYVVVHELCHLIHHNHGAGFYKLMDTSLPDWRKRKRNLEITLA